MTLTIFQGDDLKSSRQLLNAELAKLRSEGVIIHYLDGNRLTPQDLEVALSTANLFEKEALVVEHLFSRVKSKDQTTCLNLLAKYQGSKPIFLWDKKELTKTQLKLFPLATVKLAKIPVILWTLLDTLTPTSREYSLKLLHDTLKTADEGFVFIMLARRVSDLLIAKSGDSAKLTPWSRSRLVLQAKAWDERDLLHFHELLAQFDYNLKTGNTKLTYSGALDIYLSTLLC